MEDDRSVKEIYPGFRVIREDAMDTPQDTNPPDLGWEDESRDAHPHSPNSDMKDRCNITQDIKKHDMEGIWVVYKDIHSPDSGLEERYKTHHGMTECGEYCRGMEIKSSSPSMMRIDHTHEPTLVKGGDKSIEWETLTSEDGDLGVVEDDSGYDCKTRSLK